MKQKRILIASLTVFAVVAIAATFLLRGCRGDNAVNETVVADIDTIPYIMTRMQRC